MADVLVWTVDLFFQMKILETAKQLGIELKTVGTADALLAEAQGAKLVLLELDARGSALEAVAQLRSAGNRLPVIAFLSHVQVELAERARAAGCTEVMPRSKFTQNLPAILAAAKTS